MKRIATRVALFAVTVVVLIGIGRLVYPQYKVYRLESSARSGDPKAQYALGTLYDRGQHVAEDIEKAQFWYALAYEAYLSAARKGDAFAQERVAFMLFSGYGVEKNGAEAVSWWERAANTGSSGAAYNLGVAFSLGREVEKNCTASKLWLERSAQLGNEFAIHRLQEDECFTDDGV